MPAKKKTKNKSKSRSAATTTMSTWQKYCRDRDEFYRKHPWSRLLLGLFIVSFAIAIALLYYNKNVIFVGLSLDEQGIEYPYVEPLYGKPKSFNY